MKIWDAYIKLQKTEQARPFEHQGYWVAGSWGFPSSATREMALFKIEKWVLFLFTFL